MPAEITDFSIEIKMVLILEALSTEFLIFGSVLGLPSK